MENKLYLEDDFMKNIKGILMICIIIFVVFVSLSAYSNIMKKNISDKISFDYEDLSFYLDNIGSGSAVSSDGYVPNKETAVIIAKATFKNIYKYDSKDFLKYMVSFDKKRGIWMVAGIRNIAAKTGGPSILIQKSDGKILDVFHTK